MGAWGAGLYSSDFAMDLRPLIAAIARMPMPDGDIQRYVSLEAIRAAANGIVI